MSVQIRVGTDDDVPYLMRRSLKDLRNMDFVRSTENRLYFTYMHRAFEHYLVNAPVFVACQGPEEVNGSVVAGNPRRILGFIICQPSNIGLIVHYMNVRRSTDDQGHVVENYRRQGIGTKLLRHALSETGMPQSPITYTLRTGQFRNHAFRTFIGNDDRFSYNPFLFFTLLPLGWEQGIKRGPSHQPQPWAHV